MAQGLTLEQLQQMGAKPSSSGGLTLEQLQAMGATPAQKEPNLYEQIVSGVKNIGKEFTSTVSSAYKAQTEGQNPLATGIQYAGAVAKVPVSIAGGIIGKGLETVGLAEPVAKVGEIINKPIQAIGEAVGESRGVQNIAMSPIGQNIQRTAEGIQSLSELAGMVAGGKSTPSVVKPAVSGAIKTGEAIDTGISGATRFGMTQTSGLSPESIKTIVKNPQFFTKENMSKLSREDLASEVKSTIDTKLSELSDIGSGYNSIRELNTVVEIPPQSVQNVLSKYGIGVQNGELRVTAETKPFSNADLGEIKSFLTQYGDTQLSPNGFLNVREKLAQMAKYDVASGKTSNLSKLAKDLRVAYNEVGRPQIAGLKELDNLYEPEVKILSKIKKDYLTPEGNFKDGAITKIANLNNAGREMVLGRLKQIIPDIDKKVAVLRVVEDIDSAFGNKVGTYLKAGVTGGALVSGNIPLAIAGAILAYPKTAVAILRATGYTRQQIAKGVAVARKWANDVDNPRSQIIAEGLEKKAKPIINSIKVNK